MIIRQARYFRLLEICAMFAAAALIVFTGMSMKWVGFSRMLGMYLGVFFVPIALLETFAVLAERYRADRMISKSTLMASLGWTLFMLLPIALIVTESSIQYQRTLSSEYLWRQFPDSFPDLLKGSSVVIASWLMPMAILCAFLAVMKRLREEQIRWTMLLWQFAFLVVIVWGVLFHVWVNNRNVNVAEAYFSLADALNPAGTDGSWVILGVVSTPAYWCGLFIILRYAVKFFGKKNSLAGFLTAIVVGTLVMFVPRIPSLPPKAFVDFVNYSGWYRYHLNHLVPLRIWAASLFLMGGALMFTGFIWLLRREKGTVHSV